MNGGGGDDTIIGGAGNDTLNGDAGDDTFMWNAKPPRPTDGRDVVNGGTEGGARRHVRDQRQRRARRPTRIYTRAAWDALPGNNGDT